MSATDLESATASLISSVDIISDIINGDATTEVVTPSGGIPSIRKSLADNAYFQDPVPWSNGDNETNFNQLRTFTDGTVWWSPSASNVNPVPMGATPVGDSNWYPFQDANLKKNIIEDLTRFKIKGTFAAGFTYETVDDVGLDNSGNPWSYTGSLPFTVPAGTTPTTPVYKQVSFADHNATVDRNAIGAHDDIYNRTKKLSELISENLSESVNVRMSDRLFSIAQVSSVAGNLIETLSNGLFLNDVNPDIRVETYGDIGKGADDTDAFEKALLRAKNTGGGVVSCDHYTNGVVLSRTIYVPENTTLVMNNTEIKPAAISGGGVYDSNAAIIVGNPSGESRAFRCKLIGAIVDYAANDADFPARPITLKNASDSVIEYCQSTGANDRCFSVDDGFNNIVQYCYAENPRFHAFATEDGAEKTIFQFNRTHNTKGSVSGDSYCFDLSADNKNTNMSIVRFNYSTEGMRFFKGHQQAALVYGNYIETFDNNAKTTMVVGYRSGVHIFSNMLVDCAQPWLVGSGLEGPATEAYLRDNIIINRNVPIQALMEVKQDVENIVYKNNYHVHPANFVANTRMLDIDRSGAVNFTFTDNEFYITGTAVNTECFRITNLQGSEFNDNLVRTTHNVALFWLAGEDNDISRNTFITNNAGVDSVRIVSNNNSVRDNRIRGGRFRIDNQALNYYSGNHADAWNSNTTPDREPQTGSGSPVGSNTPRYVGDEYIDTAGPTLYKASGTTSSDWFALN